MSQTVALQRLVLDGRISVGMSEFPCDEEDVQLRLLENERNLSVDCDNVANIDSDDGASKALTGRRKRAAKQTTKQKPGSFGTTSTGTCLPFTCQLCINLL
jgi:hypothetical protein